MPACSIPRERGVGRVDRGCLGCPGTGSWYLSLALTLPVALSPLNPLPLTPPQEHLSGSLAALRSNQIIILKVCRFWKVSGPLW